MYRYVSKKLIHTRSEFAFDNHFEYFSFPNKKCACSPRNVNKLKTRHKTINSNLRTFEFLVEAFLYFSSEVPIEMELFVFFTGSVTSFQKKYNRGVELVNKTQSLSSIKVLGTISRPEFAIQFPLSPHTHQQHKTITTLSIHPITALLDKYQV